MLTLAFALYAAVATAQVVPVPVPAVTVDAFAAPDGGEFDVAVVTVPTSGTVLGGTLPPLSVDGVDASPMYPVADELRREVLPPSRQPVPRPGRGRLLGRLGNLIREIAGDEDTEYQTLARRVLFLLPSERSTDERAFTIAAGDLAPVRVAVRAVDDPAAHGAALSDWWAAYTTAAKDQMERSDYPARIEAYLVAMLSGRLGLPLPDWYLPPVEGDDRQRLTGTLALLGGADRVNDRIFRAVALGSADADIAGYVAPAASVADRPLPPPPNWLRETLPPDMPEVEVERLARACPPDCFYLRYGSFENYLWFKDFTEEAGGDLSRLVSIRGIRYGGALAVEKQLHLETDEMSRTLGPQVIADQALFGADLFLADGASVGTLLLAKQPFLLRTSLNGKRRQLADRDETVTLGEVEFDVPGSDIAVTLLESGDGSVRSFMAEHDSVFCVTNSRELMRRFLTVAAGGTSLADTPTFLLAREAIPVSRDSTLFVHLSPGMIRGLLSPSTLIELRRRAAAGARASMIAIASAAAGTEVQSPEALIDGGWLPETFGGSSDGSGPVVIGDSVVDSLRGRRGTYRPIADVDVRSVTAAEEAWYRGVASAYELNYPAVDPITVAVSRRPVGEDGIETLDVEAHVAPFDAAKYGKYARYLDVPTTTAMRFAPDDLVTAQVHLAGTGLTGPPTHLFAGVKDTVPPEPAAFEGALNIYRAVRSLPAYLGAWPQPGTLDRLPLGLGRGTPVAPGVNRLIGGLYRYSDGAFGILSFDPGILRAAVDTVAADEVPRPAQVRVTCGDLRGSRLEPWVNRRYYEATVGKSIAGANFLTLVGRQFDLSPERVVAAASDMLGGQIQCPLDGDYVHEPVADRWVSTAWAGAEPPSLPPPGYVAPPLKWWAGGAASLTQESTRVHIDATLRVRW